MSKTAIQQNGWREVKLGDVGTVITGKTPSQKNPEDWGSEKPFVTPSDYKNYRKFAYSSKRQLSQIGFDRLGNKILPSNSVMVTCIGSDMGKVAINKHPAITNQQINSIISDQEIVDPSFLYYRLVDMYELLRIYGTAGTAVPIVNKEDFENINIEIPPLPEQKAISEVLSSIDDKIDLLHRQNKTLEDMAQALFRKWFVEEADEEWNEKKLGDFFPIITGKKDANYSTDNGKYPFFTCAQGILRAPDYSFEGKAILLAGNGDFNVKRYEGKFEAYQRTYVLIPYEEKYFGFLYILIKFYLDQITGGAQGSVIRFIIKGMISDFTLLLPNTNIDDKLEQINQIYLKVDSNQFQIRTLEDLRDTLLPKLMSGTVRVRFDL